MNAGQQQVANQLKTFPTKEIAPAFLEAVKDRPEAEQKEAAQQLANATSALTPPGKKTSNHLWTIAVSAFSVVLVGAFLAWRLGCSR